MRVEVQINPTLEEPCAILHLSKLTSSIQTAIEILEKEGSNTIISAQAEDKIFIIPPDSIEIIRTEGGELALYNTDGKRFIVNRPLYELEQLLGNDFIRISKSALVHFFSIHHFQASFNGTMEVVMNNGIEDIITRSYKPKFKQRLEG